MTVDVDDKVHEYPVLCPKIYNDGNGNSLHVLVSIKCYPEARQECFSFSTIHVL